MKKKLAIISSHPIQYNAPLFKMLAAREVISIKVFYTWSQVEHQDKYDPGFGRIINWDIPLLEGYDFQFVKNTSSKPGSHHFFGITNPTLVSELMQWKPDVVMLYGWSFKSHLNAIRYFSGKIKLLFRGDSTLIDEPAYISLKKALRRLFLKWIYSHIDIALYTGELNRKYFLKHGLKKNQLVFAPHTIENERFYPNKDILATASSLRSSYGIKETEKVFLYAGKLEHKKQPALLINAFKRLKDEDAHLMIVGNGVLLDELKKLAHNNKRIHFMDFQNQSTMPSVYAMCDVFVLPSIGPGETWGLSVNEAMASGKAVIVSDRCGCSPDLVEEGLNGYVFKAGVEMDLFEKMKLIPDKKCALTMGGESLEKIKKWNYQAICEQVETLVNQ